VSLPEQIRVGPHTITIVSDQADMNRRSVEGKHDLDGQFDHRKNEIAVHPGQHPDQQAETLLHEILHAVFGFTKLDDLSNDEDVVNRLAPALLDTLRRNPALVMYLMGWSGDWAEDDGDED